MPNPNLSSRSQQFSGLPFTFTAKDHPPKKTRTEFIESRFEVNIKDSTDWLKIGSSDLYAWQGISCTFQNVLGKELPATATKCLERSAWQLKWLAPSASV
ncbi:hypothetical protein VP01_119g9 [Puccinia sorghi]|uniref:Uncharacterized protein n=1 Tax=Puccinia sorghi TaxID=27349 RepID=A0A0L6VQL8_9BASI|nr:hypothetical protein VP01_119g9 [Puccinia sorghi]